MASTVASARKSNFSPRPPQSLHNGTVTNTVSGTVVYGADETYVKSKEGILKILQIVFGFLAWVLMASLPYTQMIYTQGETAQFHAVMAFLLIGWLITVFFFAIRVGGWLMESKFWAKTITSIGVMVQNIVCCIFFILGGSILAANADQFDMGTSALSSFGGPQGTYNRYGYETQGRNPNSQNGEVENGKVDFGGCDNFNVNQPYCGRYPEECRKFFNECMELASGRGYNKYYINAIVCCIFIFLCVIFYLIAAILACKGSADLFSDDYEAGNDVEVNHVDLNQSLRSHSWNRSQKKDRNSRNESYIINEKPRDTSTVKSYKQSNSKASSRSGRH